MRTTEQTLSQKDRKTGLTTKIKIKTEVELEKVAGGRNKAQVGHITASP